MSKTIEFKMPSRPASADAWVQASGARNPEPAAPPEPMKRFTIDVPVGLHCRVKIACAKRGLKMADVLRDLLEREFPAA
jgi:ParG